MPAMTSRSQLLLVVALAAVTILATQPAYATEQSAGVFGGIWQFVLEGQRELTNGMTAAVRQIKSGNIVASGAVLAFISFLYGVLHAVGPGHGKFVISSYALANERTVRRGILLSFMAAFVQAISAIVIVGILAIILNATSVQLRVTEAWLETASWGLIALLGAWLLYGQIRRMTAKPQHAVQDTHLHHHHDHTHDHHHGHHHGHHHAHDHEHAADGSCCGHTHVAAPSQLQGQWSWSRAWALAFSIGIRPCTGAIGVLVFSLGMDIFWAGVFATFAMAIGTAITVSVLASLAVGSRELAARLGGGADSRWAHRIQAAAGLGGSALVMILGASFFFASLSGMSPL
jgi:ABC-type nickel/cobalt efflux system permease component RcnA